MDSLKRKHSVLEKTPISMLQELCDQEKEALSPSFELVSLPPNSQKFICTIKAFDVTANGLGGTKKEAKHKACADIIGQLANMKRFVDKLSPNRQTITTNGDAIGTLIGICSQRSWPIPTFDVKRTGGEQHCPVFTATCQVSSIKRLASSSTVKNAKQNAARAVLDIIGTQNQLQLEPVVSEPPEKIFRLYHEIRKTPQAVSTAKTLSNRHNFFLQLPENVRIRARKILLDESGVYGTNEDKLHLTCSALQLGYDIKNANRKPGTNYKIFALTNGYDCVLMGQVPELYGTIIDYFKTMLNIHSY